MTYCCIISALLGEDAFMDAYVLSVYRMDLLALVEIR